ncbi:unnamed protein product [Periconia digitata]|uniref:Uncharacterized protein n=1 Tax=Periconia digitata TaxID=1303443 RepID=A0A9W4UT04_9PLEO|nr:unnamed protein product [Periconia digitata]
MVGLARMSPHWGVFFHSQPYGVARLIGSSLSTLAFRRKPVHGVISCSGDSVIIPLFTEAQASTATLPRIP